ncbi:MAG TPA: phospholipase D family protein [Syntrophus sp. (in: bacteria)]|nr:phospholipase D family protein [Syntrophus sp. (in: bacteria)]
MHKPNRVRSSFFYRLVPVFAVGALVLLSVVFFRGPAARAISVDAGHLPPIEVYFSPHSGSTTAIVREIDRARSEILVQAYSFTSAPIAHALLKAHRRGIRVEVILDKSQKSQRYSSFTFLTNTSIPTYIDAEHAIAHNKIILIDRSVVITGSFNFTKAAEEKNAENLLIIRSKELTKQYLDNWLHHRDHSGIV